MKLRKLFSGIITLLLTITFVLCGCDNGNKEKEIVKAPDNEIKALWISQYDYQLKGLGYNDFCKRIDTMFDNAVNLGINTLFVHVRANGDAYYQSEYYPWTSQISGTEGVSPNYDPLAYMTASAHSRNLKIHAWINPLRVSQTDDISLLSEQNIAGKYLRDDNPENDRNLMLYAGKYYLNPAEDEAVELILNGIKEICENYDVDGIHFDDYFYPSSDKSLDELSFSEYCDKTQVPLTLTEWRTANISKLVSSVYRTVKSYGLPFGVSPAGQIKGEYLLVNGYADVKNWLKSEGYVDYLIPQIYWGFEYPAKEYRFDNCLKDWLKLKRSKCVKLYIGLPAYKVGTNDKGDEWEKNSDILKRQINCVRYNNLDGFALFSYSSLFSNNELNTEERNNIKSII